MVEHTWWSAKIEVKWYLLPFSIMKRIPGSPKHSQFIEDRNRGDVHARQPATKLRWDQHGTFNIVYGIYQSGKDVFSFGSLMFMDLWNFTIFDEDCSLKNSLRNTSTIFPLVQMFDCHLFLVLSYLPLTAHSSSYVNSRFFWIHNQVLLFKEILENFHVVHFRCEKPVFCTWLYSIRLIFTGKFLQKAANHSIC